MAGYHTNGPIPLRQDPSEEIHVVMFLFSDPHTHSSLPIAPIMSFMKKKTQYRTMVVFTCLFFFTLLQFGKVPQSFLDFHSLGTVKKDSSFIL